MFRSRVSTAWFLVWAGLLLASFRPGSPIEPLLDLVLTPLRVAAELAAPLELLRVRSASAAERTLAESAELEAREGADALARLAARTQPADPALVAARRFVHGEVVDRPDKDHCLVQVQDASGIEPGCPVVSGDAFVGRVTEVLHRGQESDAPPATLLVELVTARWFRIGAVVDQGGEQVFLTVGGVQARSGLRGRQRDVRLAAHQPSASTLGSGLARVHELFAEAGEMGRLAEGFRLGEVVRDGERGPRWIEPELDYLDGLFQVAIVTRADAALPEVAPFAPALRDSAWLETRALTFGDPSPWRSTVKIALGRADGAGPGSAVTGVGARLLGRVMRVGLATSDVALLGDPGFTLGAVALLEGDAEPRILGRVTTLARGNGDTIRMRWWVRVPLEARSAPGEARSAPGEARSAPGAANTAESSDGASGATVRARLFTGSGDPGLPAGLFLGETELPRAARPGDELELVLRPGVDPSDVRRLFVRRISGAQASERGP